MKEEVVISGSKEGIRFDLKKMRKYKIYSFNWYGLKFSCQNTIMGFEIYVDEYPEKKKLISELKQKPFEVKILNKKLWQCLKCGKTNKVGHDCKCGRHELCNAIRVSKRVKKI